MEREKKIRETCESKYIVKQLLGKGKEGNVFLLCRTNKSCANVVKVTPLTHVDRSKLGNELFLAEKAANSNLAPSVIDQWICNGKEEPLPNPSLCCL